MYLTDEEADILERHILFMDDDEELQLEEIVKKLRNKKSDRELVNTSCTLYRDQIEHADNVEGNVSLYARKAIDFYWKRGEKT